jgi:MoxR-like ATPase
LTQQLAVAAELAKRVAGNVGRVIIGKSDVVRLVVTALLAEGHVLIEDEPGVGKTSIARVVAAVVDLSWHRIQFTPDLLPS